MIKVKLNGGLGNQMFQYALGRSLTYRRRTKLATYFRGSVAGDTAWKYSLGCFTLSPDSTIRISPDLSAKLQHLVKLFFGESKNLVKEKSFNFDPDVLKVPDNVILEGYWQSEKYFIDDKDLIRKDYEFKENLIGKNAQLAKKITSSNSVSLHIRRGDYVSDKKTNDFHGTSGLDYYKKSLGYIKKRVKSPMYFVFSDDIAWAKDNLKLPNATFIDWNQADKSYVDMQLMSLCKHNIIANSSFSWWGAWLNNNPSKIVIAPKIWFKDPSVDTSDLLPKDWLRI